MKVAYIFKSNMASTFQFATMILPQLEQGKHGAEVAGMMFFDDNLFCLAQGNDVGMKLAKVAKENNIVIIAKDQPIRRLPVSPKNTFAGNLLYFKNAHVPAIKGTKKNKKR